MAQRMLTAVGLVDIIVSIRGLRAAVNSSKEVAFISCADRATPIAAAIPMAGAPDLKGFDGISHHTVIAAVYVYDLKW